MFSEGVFVLLFPLPLFFQFTAPWAVIILLSTPLWAGGSDTALTEKAQHKSVLLSERGLPLYEQYCSHCHGNKGEGDGYNAEYLDKEPANLSDGEFLGKKSNDQIYRVIHKGGAGVKKSHLMPIFGGTLSEEEIWSLVAYVRKLSGDTDHPVQVPEDASRERPRLPVLGREDVSTFAKAPGTVSADTLALGEKLFRKKKSCVACHGLDDEGGRVGPDLSRAGALYPREWLMAWLQNPQTFSPDTKMPNIGLDAKEAGALALYLGSRTGEGVPIEWKVYLNAKGDPERGRKIFFDPEGKAYCSKCHRAEQQGGRVGPDLSWIGSKRTPGFLLESLLDPKAVITSGYSTVMILTKDRKFITGVKKSEDDSSITLVDKEGAELTIQKDLVKKFKTQKISTMPANFGDLLDTQEVADLLAFLKTQKHPLFAAHP